MASLLKKKSEPKAPQVPPWHPNLRNVERLPDTKVVRTAFFINVAIITVAAVLLLYVGKDAWQYYSYNSQIAEWQRQIDRDQKGSDQAIALGKKFALEEAKFTEVQNFVGSRPEVSQLLVHLASTLPRNIALDSFELRDVNLRLKATIRGAPDQASGWASSYVDQLRADKALAMFDEITPTATGRNPASGRVTIDILLHLKVKKK